MHAGLHPWYMCVYYAGVHTVYVYYTEKKYMSMCIMQACILSMCLAILLSAMALRQQIFPRCMQPCIFWRAYARKVSVVSFFVVTLHYA
jgi:hypothetical protein